MCPPQGIVKAKTRTPHLTPVSKLYHPLLFRVRRVERLLQLPSSRCEVSCSACCGTSCCLATNAGAVAAFLGVFLTTFCATPRVRLGVKSVSPSSAFFLFLGVVFFYTTVSIPIRVVSTHPYLTFLPSQSDRSDGQSDSGDELSSIFFAPDFFGLLLDIFSTPLFHPFPPSIPPSTLSSYPPLPAFSTANLTPTGVSPPASLGIELGVGICSPASSSSSNMGGSCVGARAAGSKQSKARNTVHTSAL